MRAVLLLAAKDLRLLVRDRIGFFFTFFFPLLFAIFFGTIFSGGDNGGGPIKVMVVDEDQSDGSQAFLARLSRAPEIEVTEADSEWARRDLRRGKSAAMIVLPAGFGAARQRPFRPGGTALSLTVDPARRAEAGMLQGILTKYLYEGFQEILTDRPAMRREIKDSIESLRGNAAKDDPLGALTATFLGSLDHYLAELPVGEDERLEWQPFRLDTTEMAVEHAGPSNSYAVSFPQGIVWGILGCAAAFGISLVVERNRGTLVRMRLAPLRHSQILAGKAVACFVTTMAVTLTMMLVARLAFGVEIHSPWLLLAALGSSGLAFVGIMMFLSVLGRTEQAAGGIGWAILMVLAMIGGGMVPHFLMPSWMQTISHFSPVKWAILAIEGAVWRGFSAGEMLLPCAILVAVGVVFFAIGARAFRWSG